MQAANGVEDGLQAATQLVIVALIETLQIHFVEVEPWAQVFEHLRSAVAVGDESGNQSGRFGFLHDGDGPLGGDERLVVGADQHLRALLQRVAHQGFGRGFERCRDRLRIAEGLRGHPVLAVGAVEIAAEHAEAVGECSGIGVEEGLLLDGVALHAADVSPGDIEGAVAIETNFADARLTFGDRAAVSASETAHTVPIELFVQVTFPDAVVH